jgi:hypothetical protein
MSLERVVISTNNDCDKQENRGLDAAVKNYLKLLEVFEPGKLKICLPTKNDFGDMAEEDFDEWGLKLNNILRTNQAPEVRKLVEGLASRGKVSKKLLSRKKLLL